MGIMVMIGVLALAILLFLQHPQFGQSASGERLERIRDSPNYADGEFRNLDPGPIIVQDEEEEEGNFLLRLIKHFTNRPDGLYPDSAMPTVKTDLHALDRDRDLIIWFGHSSYFVQLDGHRILVDPVFSNYGSPLPFINRAFRGTSIYSSEDMPEIDYILITHEHWDHLDYPTMKEMKPKTGKVIAGLGVGAHFERWGYEPDRIIDADWYDRIEGENGFTIHVMPARHYSQRKFDRNQTLWVGFVIETPDRRIYISGDSGYGKHVAEIARRFDRFDLVAPDFGQYDDRWPLVHKTPEEASQVAEELKADALIFGHIGRFSLANHTWDDPFKRIAEVSKEKDYRLLTPRIGETVYLDDEDQIFFRWWEEADPVETPVDMQMQPR